jgi:hypothetical protein
MYIPDEDDLSKLFHGARLMRGGNQVNEVITCSFDPSTLNCLAFPTPHRILDSCRPVTLCFADQNFVLTICCSSSCIAVVRYEDATLSDLAATAIELLDRHSIHPGSVILLGSATHLYRVGVSKYAADWTEINYCLEQKFKNINICPLVPVSRESGPGQLGREIEHFATWLRKVYSNSIKGVLESWDAVVHFIHNASVGNLPAEDIIKINLPADLHNNVTVPTLRIAARYPPLSTE